MEIRQLKTFLVTAQLLNFNRAAEILNYAQSTVSSQIRGLEQELGVPLFDRLGKRIALTEAGKKMVRYARKITDMETETLAEVSEHLEPAGSISIRIPQSLGTHILPGVLNTFKKQYPRVNLNTDTCSYESLKQELRSGIIDVAFLLLDEINEPDLKSEVLGFVNLIFICANDNPFAGQMDISLKELSQQTLILPKYDCHYKVPFAQNLTEQNIKPLSILEINSIETIKACVKLDVGVTIIPEFAIQKDLSNGKYAQFQLKEGPMETAVLLLRHKNKWQSQYLKTFIAEVRNHFSKHT
ncbi:LysR family transcriptional regulator [Maridesulfovibrio sp.]|uniref:LysR family transcriptional regulator n=1 Tax=Maridesulfovibrio sp. TaxID=2795000 RepID=UPI003BA858F5